MLPINKIVCPTDFSEASHEGLKAAVELAEHFQADLIVLNVVSPVPVVSGAGAPTGFHLPTLMNEMQAAAEKSIANLIAEMASEFGAVDFRPVATVDRRLAEP